MKHLTRITVEINNERFVRHSGTVLTEARIKVNAGADQYELVQVVPDDDFERRFDWFMDRAKKEIVDLIRKSRSE